MTRAHLVIALLVALPGLAAAQPKPQPLTNDKYTRAARDTFTEAIAADQRGDLREALVLYQKAFAIAPHPATMFNIADVYRRLGQIALAITHYETYLALAPDAPDRSTVEATVAKLEQTPATIQIMQGDKTDFTSVDLQTAYILIDGKIAVKPGTEPRRVQSGGFAITFDVPPGQHVIDVVTPITYGFTTCGGGPGTTTPCSVHAQPRIDGAVVVSTADRAFKVRPTPKPPHFSSGRIELPPGRHKLMLEDRSFECPALIVEAPRSDDEVVYVHVQTREPLFERCRKLTLVRQRLTF